jgi:predicted Rossmann fold nucleotide-binding protein DprA/Smf involved in DNA uptake
MYYTGVGSRECPTYILDLMTQYATVLNNKGYILRSGGALGADSAFQSGSTNR